MTIKRAVTVAIVVVGFAAGTAIAARAGGWAVVVLDDLPRDVVPGKAFTVGFTVRQHGVTPLSDLDPAPSVTARNASSREVVRAVSMGDEVPGHYQADVVLPSVGEWTWTITAFGGEGHPMPKIIVAASPAAGEGAARPPQPSDRMLLFAAAGLAGAGIVLAFRRRFAFSATALLFAGIAGGLGALNPAATAPAPAEASPSSLADRGAALFLAKGCVTCHVNQDVPESEDWSLSIGPDLSRYANDPSFLARWLADPAAVRPGTEMPDLGLSSGEIEALIAFLTEGD